MKCVILGSSGFIGSHLRKRLLEVLDDREVVTIDIRLPTFFTTNGALFHWHDLRMPTNLSNLLRGAHEVYQLAADMGGAGYCFTGEHDAAIMRNNVLINTNVLDACVEAGVGRVFFSSSACVYADFDGLNDLHENAAGWKCRESDAYPAQPDSDYGFEKLFSERLYQAYARNYALDVRIARFHNIFGPYGAWNNGREKAPAAICRKVAEAQDGTFIDVWGDGEQTRSFLYIDECIEGMLRLMRSDFPGPVNIGSDHMISINQLVDQVCAIAGKTLKKHHILGPVGVRGRNSDNRLIHEKLGWAPDPALTAGLTATYAWVKEQVDKAKPPA